MAALAVIDTMMEQSGHRSGVQAQVPNSEL